MYRPLLAVTFQKRIFGKFLFCTLFQEICGQEILTLEFSGEAVSKILILQTLFFSLIFLSDHFYHFNQILFRLSPLESLNWEHRWSSECKVYYVAVTALYCSCNFLNYRKYLWNINTEVKLQWQWKLGQYNKPVTLDGKWRIC